MKLPYLISSAVAGICLVLSIWLFIDSLTNQNLQGELQQRQQELQTAQEQFQLQQQQFQLQQEKINAGTQLAKEVGPAVLRDLGSLAVQSKNEQIKKLLAKYGVSVKEDEAAKPATR